MDKFEQIIKQAVEGYEAPFNPQAWENVSNELGDSFEQLIKDSTTGYEAPYNPAAWDAVTSQLGPVYSAWKWIGGSAAAIAIIAGASFFLDNSDTDNNLTNHPSNEVVINGTNNAVDNNLYANEEVNTNSNISLDPSNNEGEINTIIHPIDSDINHTISIVDQVNENNDILDNNQDGLTGHEDLGDNVDPNVNTNENPTNAVDNSVTDYKANSKFTISARDGNVTEICQGDACIFKPEDLDNELVYLWNYGDGGLASTVNGKHSFNKAGEFVVTLKVKNPTTGKILGTSSETIQVNELPSTLFSMNQKFDGIPTVQFVNETLDGEAVVWNLGGLKQSIENEVEYTFRRKGTYTISLTTKNEYGCMHKAEQEIKIENDYNLTNQTAFSPDGDGQFDNFIPGALALMGVDFTMTVMDKSGKLVYTTQNAYEPWDGRYTEDNTMAPSGSSYIWRVVLINSDGEQEVYDGQVFVVY
jgi:PKD domain/CHU_C Type IX secretion signal domain